MNNGFLKKTLVLFMVASVGSVATAEITIVRSESYSTQVVQTASSEPSKSEYAVTAQAVRLSVDDGDFQAPAIATSVSPQNAKVFNAQIPQYANQIKLRNPPSYVGCFYSSSRKYGVPADLMMAIAQTESSFNHRVSGRLVHGTDHGLMQINDYWVPKLRKRFNITLTDIYDPCTNIEIAAWILAHNLVQFGYSWRAVGAYNAVTEWKREVYIKKVANNLKKLHAGQI